MHCVPACVHSCLQQHRGNQEDAFTTELVPQLRLLLDLTPGLTARELVACPGLVSALLTLGEVAGLSDLNLSVWSQLLCWFPLWAQAPVATQVQLLEVCVCVWLCGCVAVWLCVAVWGAVVVHGVRLARSLAAHLPLSCHSDWGSRRPQNPTSS